jgi:hypothetical protein
MPENKPKRDGFIEVGTSGLKRYSGYINEEFLPELQGQRGIRVYREMWENSPVIGAMMRAITLLARAAEKRVDPGGESTEDERAAELVLTGLDDMSQSWDDTLCEILSMLPMGFSWHEIIYKFRRGEDREPGKSSQYDDGLLGWRKLPIRSQDSLDRWDVDDEGGLQGFIQRAPPKYEEVNIPIAKSLLFRPEIYKNNPEGHSVIRCAYRPYYMVRRIEEIEGIGIERELNGYPVAKIPGSVIQDNGTAYTQWQDMVTNIRVDEQEQHGAVIPSDVDENGNPLYTLELLSTGGRRGIDTTAVIDRYNRLMAMTVLEDFLFVGQGSTGTQALVGARIPLFLTAMDGWLGQVASVFNRHGIPRLLAANNIRVDQPDPAILAEALGKLSAAGFNLAGDERVEQWVRDQVDLPEMTDEDLEMMAEAREQRREDDQTAGQDELRRQAEELMAQRGNTEGEEDAE